MLIHHYEARTGQYLSSNLTNEDPQRNGRWLVPPFATHTPLPERPPKTWPFWRNKQWIFLPDYRGCVLYRTDNGSPCEILEIGFTPEQCGLTEKPRPSPDYKWCDGEWVIDDEALKRQKIAATMAEYERRMKKAQAANEGKTDALAAGLLTDLEQTIFKAWATYQVELRRTIHAPDFPETENWPNEPDEQAIAQKIATTK